MSSGPSWVVAYEKKDGTSMEVFCSTETAARDYKQMIEKVDPTIDARVEKR